MSYPGREFEIRRHRLANGMRVVLHPDPTLPLVAVNLWYHVGSKNERPGKTGFAHLFEHMLFQGSEHVDTNGHFRLVQQVGGVANGSTWFDRTNYYETLPAHHLELALWLEADRMGFLLPAMTLEKLETQRGVVMNERRQRVDNQPYGRAYEHLQELLYAPEFPYHWPVIGYMDDIAAATLDDVREFFRTWYTPANAVLTLAGDLESGAALEAVDRHFGHLPQGVAPPPVDPELPPLGGEQRAVLEDDVRLPRVYVAFRAPRFGDPGWYAADLLSNVWATGKSSFLYHELVYRLQIAQEVVSWISPTEEVATLAVSATARPGVSAEELEAALVERIDRFQTVPVSEDDLERARNRALTDHFSDLVRLDRRADLLSQFTTYFDDPERLAGEGDRYAAVTPDNLLSYAARHTVAEERVVVAVVPANGR